MSELILTAEQSSQLEATAGPVLVRDARGAVVGYLQPAERGSQSDEELSSERIAELLARRNEPGPRLTTAEVLEYLHSLES